MFGCVLVGCLSCQLVVCLVLHEMFLHGCFRSIFSFLCVKNSKTHKKLKIQKVWSTLLSFVSKHVLPCTFVLMALCIYECSLFPMHLYHCGRTLDIYVTVVNRSSTLLWMTSEWLCWSWDMHRLVPIYLPTLLFFLLKRAHQI